MYVCAAGFTKLIQLWKKCVELEDNYIDKNRGARTPAT
jgi:hypothetical protein